MKSFRFARFVRSDWVLLAGAAVVASIAFLVASLAWMMGDPAPGSKHADQFQWRDLFAAAFALAALASLLMAVLCLGKFICARRKH